MASLEARLNSLKTREEQIAAIVAETDPIRFFDDRSGYFFAYDFNGVRINVPINKSQNNQNMMGVQDKKGIRFVEELIKAAKAGGGFVEYFFEKEGKGIQPKLGFAMKIPGTEFMLGTGSYIDNVQTEKAVFDTQLRSQYAAVRIWAFILVSLIAVVILGATRAIAKSINKSIGLVINEVDLNSKRVAYASAQVSEASQSLARDAGNQAASLEETSSSLEEMSSKTKRNSEAADKAKDLANQSRGAADQGVQSMNKINAALREFSVSSDEMRQAMDSVKSSQPRGGKNH